MSERRIERPEVSQEWIALTPDVRYTAATAHPEHPRPEHQAIDYAVMRRELQRRKQFQ